MIKAFLSTTFLLVASLSAHANLPSTEASNNRGQCVLSQQNLFLRVNESQQVSIVPLNEGTQDSGCPAVNNYDDVAMAYGGLDFFNVQMGAGDSMTQDQYCRIFYPNNYSLCMEKRWR